MILAGVPGVHDRHVAGHARRCHRLVHGHVGGARCWSRCSASFPRCRSRGSGAGQAAEGTVRASSGSDPRVARRRPGGRPPGGLKHVDQKDHFDALRGHHLHHLIRGRVVLPGHAIGLARFRDTIGRMHASTKPQTLGLSLTLLGTVLHIFRQRRRWRDRQRRPGACSASCCSDDVADHRQPPGPRSQKERPRPGRLSRDDELRSRGAVGAGSGGGAGAAFALRRPTAHHPPEFRAI